MAARKSKQHTTRKQASPSLDDPRWVSLIKAHHICSEQLTGDRFSDLATVELMEALRSGKLRCMGRNSANPSERKLVPSSFWQDRRILLIDGHLQIRGKLHGPGKGVYWDLFVWEPDIDTLWPAERPVQQMTGMSPSGKPPGPKPRGDWQLHVARELYARAKAGEKDPTAPTMIRYCIETIGYAPDDSDMRKLVKSFREHFETRARKKRRRAKAN